MLAKTFKGGRTLSGARATIAYLLNERVGEGTAKVLVGNPELTLSIIKEAEKKQKWSWSSGVLTFSETLDRETIAEIMAEFEKTFFAGLKKDQYNMLWVLHEDKGRTELHYVAPRLELSTGLSYNPYFVKRDFAKKDLFQELINLTHDLASYKDNREITPQPPKCRDKAKKEDIRQSFDEALLPLVKEGIITSREELVLQLSEWGFELNRAGKGYISVIDENNKKHRLKGLIYGESFTSWENIEREIEAERGVLANGVPRELGAIRTELDNIIRQQTFTNRNKYKRNGRNQDAEANKRQSQSIQGNDRERDKDNKKDTVVSFPHRPYLWLDVRRVKHPIPLTAKGVDSQRERDSREQRGAEVSTDRKDIKSTDNEKGEISDSTRTEAFRRIRRTRERTAERARAYAKTIHELREKHRGLIEEFNSQISIELDRAYTKRGQRTVKLNSLLTNLVKPTKGDYRDIKEATEKRGCSRAVGENIDALTCRIRTGISRFIRNIKQEFSGRTQNLIVGVSNVVKKRKLFERGKKKAMFQLRSKKINLLPRR